MNNIWVYLVNINWIFNAMQLYLYAEVNSVSSPTRVPRLKSEFVLGFTVDMFITRKFTLCYTCELHVSRYRIAS